MATAKIAARCRDSSNTYKGHLLQFSDFLIFSNAPLDSHCLKITQNVAFEFWHFPPFFV